MNLKAAAAIGLFLLDKGGAKAVSDFRTVTVAVMAVRSGKAPFDSLTAPAILDAIESILTLLASATGDAATRNNVVALIQSL